MSPCLEKTPILGHQQLTKSGSLSLSETPRNLISGMLQEVVVRIETLEGGAMGCSYGKMADGELDP